MTVDTGIIVTVIGDEFLEFNSRFGQRLDGEGDILDKTGSADGSCATHTGEDAGADSPILTIDSRILGELSRDIEFELTQARLDGFDLVKQLLVSNTLGFRQDSRQVMIVAWLHTFDLASIHILLILQINRVIDRTQRFVVEHLSRLYHQVFGTHLQVFLTGFQFLHRHHRLATLLHRQEIDHRRCLVLIVVECLHRHFREEGQRTLRPYHRVGDDVERIIVSYQRTEVQARHVFNRIFGTYA